MIVVAGIASLLAQLYVFPSDVDPDEWQKPADYVLDHVRQEDGIAVHPAWNEDPLPYLEAAGPQILPQETILAEDIQGVRRIWLLSEADRLDAAIDRLPFDPSRPTIKSFGDVSVVRTQVPSSIRFNYEFLAHLDEARVERVEGESVRHCENWSAEDRRWDCGSRDTWLYVGENLATLGDDLHRCIWAHPLDGKKRLRITFPDVPMRRLLRIRAGLIFRVVHKDNRAPVHLRVDVGGETRLEHTYPPHTTTWVPHDIDISGLDGTSDVTVEVWTPNIKDRWFCFNGWVR